MKRAITLLASYFLLSAFTVQHELPEDWFKAGSSPNDYEMGLDNQIIKSGNSSAFIFSLKKKVKGFGTLMQSSLAKEYVGKLIRLSGYIKTENVDDWAGMWLRIDGVNRQNLGFDNMKDRAISGTENWKYCEIVMDIPEGSQTLNYGVLLSGTGKVWFDDFSIEEVTPTVEPTNPKFLDSPSNLNFEN